MTTPLRLTYIQKVKIKRLYIDEGMAPIDIADLTSFNRVQISNYVSKSGLAKQRKQIEDRVVNLSDIEANSIEELSDFNDAVAGLAQETTLKGLHGALDSSDGKDFSGFMSGAKTGMDMFRRARGLDNNMSAGVQVNLQVLLANPEQSKPIDI